MMHVFINKKNINLFTFHLPVRLAVPAPLPGDDVGEGDDVHDAQEVIVRPTLGGHLLLGVRVYHLQGYM